MDICQLHHVSLIVSDTGRALDFYHGLLGLPVDCSRPDLSYPGAWLQVGGQQIHLLEVPNPDPVADRPAHGGRDRHTAFAVSDVEGLAQRLEEAGMPLSRSRSGRPAFFCRDPDGNGLEFVQSEG